MNGDPKILVIEDELITAQHLKQSLTRLGYQVIGIASTGPAAIQIAEHQTPDLVLADIRLQNDEDGITVASELQRRWRLPVIFLTALADSETLQRARVIEPYGYLVKPFSADDLHASIEIALYRKMLFEQRSLASEANARLLERTKEELYALAARLTAAQEEERKRLARDLHDDLGQRMALLQMEVERLQQSLTADVRRRLNGQFRIIVDSVGELLDELRRVSHGLHPAALEELGLEVALRQLTTNFEERHQIRTRFSVRSLPAYIPKDAALSLYRIVQEALTNVWKHAEASSVDITVAGEEDSLTLFVRDTGRGFDPDQVKHVDGLGLISMRQRAELMGGTLELKSQPGHGSQIVACLPLR